MRLLIQLTALILCFQAVLILAGCATQNSTTTSQRENEETTPSQELALDSQNPTVEITPGSDSRVGATEVAEVGMDLLENLGYDTPNLEVISMELLPHDSKLIWEVTIGNELGQVAIFTVNEQTLRFEQLGFIYIRDGVLATENVSPDVSLPGRIADAMGLVEDGFQLVVEREPGQEYRKYANWNDYQIAVSFVVVVVPPEAEIPILLDWREGELREPVEINIDHDTAVSAAVSHLSGSTSGMVPTMVELVQLPNTPDDYKVYWEVVFSEQAVHVDAADGSILGG